MRADLDLRASRQRDCILHQGLSSPATSSIPIPVKTLHLDADELALNFEQCLKLANAAADHLLAKQGGAMLLSFNYGRGRYVFCYRPLADNLQAD